MISAVAGKTIETLIKHLIPNDKSHYLKSSWIDNGKSLNLMTRIYWRNNTKTWSDKVDYV